MNTINIYVHTYTMETIRLRSKISVGLDATLLQKMPSRNYILGLPSTLACPTEPRPSSPLFSPAGVFDLAAEKMNVVVLARPLQDFRRTFCASAQQTVSHYRTKSQAQQNAPIRGFVAPHLATTPRRSPAQGFPVNRVCHLTDIRPTRWELLCTLSFSP